MEKENLYCHYSDLPSPMAYLDDTMDYDGMGNHGRFPKKKSKRKTILEKIAQRVMFWNKKYLTVIKKRNPKKR
jgi:hypothetical protein